MQISSHGIQYFSTGYIPFQSMSSTSKYYIERAPSSVDNPWYGSQLGSQVGDFCQARNYKQR